MTDKEKLAAYDGFLEDLKIYLNYRVKKVQEYDYFEMGIAAEAKIVLEKITKFRAELERVDDAGI